MASFYHGSVWRYLLRSGVYGFRQRIKSVRRRFTRSEPEHPEISKQKASLAQAIAAMDWPAAKDAARALAAAGENMKDAAAIGESASALERLGDHGECWQLRLRHRHLTSGKFAKEWNGEDLAGKNLLIEFVEFAKQSIGRVIRHARFVDTLAARAASCTVAVEERLVPIFQRSFPRARVIPISESLQAERDRADVIATFEQLSAMLATGGKEIADTFAPLVADKNAAAELRSKYRKGKRLLIGVSWGSKSHSKDGPAFSDWIQFMWDVDATFVSLQYGNISAAVKKLQNSVGEKFVYDETVDQLVDMDRFAAQLASLDAVVSISNTGAHLAGALDIPLYILVDDGFHTFWPVSGGSTPWYPKTEVVNKNGRAWADVLADVRARIEQRFGRR